MNWGSLTVENTEKFLDFIAIKEILNFLGHSPLVTKNVTVKIEEIQTLRFK